MGPGQGWGAAHGCRAPPAPLHVVSFEQPWTQNAETWLEGPLSTVTRNHCSWGLSPAAFWNWGR